MIWKLIVHDLFQAISVIPLMWSGKIETSRDSNRFDAREKFSRQNKL